MRDTALTKALEAQVIEADSTSQEVGEQRERNYRYYTLQPIGNEIAGRSHYISPDVLESVEDKKALMAQTFLSGRQCVKFKSGGQVSKDLASALMDYTNRQLRRCHISEIMRDGWHDAYLAKRMVVHGRWDDRRQTETIISVDGMAFEQVAQAITRLDNVEDVDDTAVEDGEDGGLTGEIVVTQSDHGIDLELVQPELYYRDPNVPYVREAMFAGYQRTVARAQLILDGYEPEQVMDLRRDYRWHRYEEEYARKAHDNSQSSTRQYQRNELHEEVDVYRTYCWLTGQDVLDAAEEPDEWAQAIGIDPENVNQLDLYEIHWTTGEVLHWADGTPAIRRAQEIPFFEWTEYKISHAENGMADADVVAHTQKSQSSLKRLAIDNQQMRNTSRWEAVKSMVWNPRDLLDTRIGGVVWTKQPGMVRALDTPELSPMTMQVMAMLDRDRQRRSGISDVATGMNENAVRYQNAEDMIERLADRGTRRPMRGARDFAETWLVPLCQFIVRLAARHDQQTHYLEVRGQQVPYVPSQMFPHDTADMEVHSALTPDETRRYAQSLYMMDQTLSQKPEMKPLYGLVQQHAVFDEIYDALGVTDSSPFLLSPESPEAQQRFQAIQQQNQQAQMASAAATEFTRNMMQSADGREWMKARLEGIEVQSKVADTVADNVREDQKQEFDEGIQEREMRVKERDSNAA